jgi:amino acid transporter
MAHTAEDSKKQQVIFVREATGLRKNVSFLDAISLNVGVMSAGPTLAVIGLTMVLLTSVSGINLVYAALISAVIVIPLMIVYTMLGRRISRTGGDYVWVSRAFGGLIGTSAAFTGFVIATMAFSALSILSLVFAIGSIGTTFGNPSFLPLAIPGNSQGANTTLQFAVGAIIYLCILGINIGSARLGFKLTTVFALVSIVAILVAIGTLVFNGQSGVSSYVSTLNSEGANVTYAGLASSYTGPSFNFSATFFLMPIFAIFAYPYLNWSPLIGSELKRGNAQRWNAPIAYLIVTILLAGGLGAMYYAGGQGFVNIAYSNPTLVYTYSFNFFTMAMGVTSNIALQWIIAVGWLASWLAVLMVNMIGIPRYLFAMSFDRSLPSKLSYVSPRLGTPVLGLLAFAIPTLILMGLAAFLYGTIVSLYGVVVATMVYFVIVGLAAVSLALKKEKGAARMVMAISGILTAIVFAYMSYLFFAYPAVWGGNNLAYGFALGGLVFIVVAYLASKAFHNSKGIDISLAFKEIPPE